MESKESQLRTSAIANEKTRREKRQELGKEIGLGRTGTYTFVTRLYPETFQALKQIRQLLNIKDDTALMELLAVSTIEQINLMNKVHKYKAEQAKESQESSDKENKK